MEIILEKGTPNYRRYKILSKDAAGTLIAERVFADIWRIELLKVYPERRGYGTLLLKHAMTDLHASKIVTHAITRDSANFFKKNGFVNDKGYIEHYIMLHQ